MHTHGELKQVFTHAYSYVNTYLPTFGQPVQSSHSFYYVINTRITDGEYCMQM